MITRMDRDIGKIMDLLNKLDLVENTLLFFTSDNGPHQEGKHKMEFFNSNGSLRGMKRDYYEGGIKTPFVAKWPDKIEAGSQSDHISAFWDFLPTVCDIANVEKPEDIDGISYLPTLLGNEEQQKEHEYLYWEFYEQGGKQAVIKDNYKAVRLDVRTGNPKPIELYNLNTDPGEQENIADQHPELVEQMKGYMEEAHEPLDFISLFKDETNADTPF